MPTLEHAGLDFDVDEYGPEDGPAVVLLHGFPQSRVSWMRTARELADAGHRVWVPDQRGYSSGAHVAGRLNYRLPDVVGDVAALIRSMSNDPVHVVGHDFGATVAWMLAAHQPELVRTLTAVSVPHPGAHRKALRTTVQGLRSWYMFALQVPLLPEWILSRPGMVERFMIRSGQAPGAARRDDGALAGRHGDAVNWYRGLFLTPAGYQAVHAQRPTLQIYGEKDAFVARASIDNNPEFVDASYRLEVLSGLGHWLPDEAGTTIAELIRAHIAHPVGTSHDPSPSE